MGKSEGEFDIVKQIGDSSAEGVVIYSLMDEKVIYANSPAVDLVGLKTNSLRDDVESVIDRIPDQDREYLNHYLATHGNLASGEVEFRMMRSGDEQIFLCCNAFLVADRSAVIVFIRDITSQKEQKNYLVEYGARKNTVLDIVAHDISGALNVMKNLTAQAVKYIEESTDENLRVYLRLLNENSNHCLEIIHGLLKHEHTESPLVAVKIARIDAIEVISFIYEELAASYRARKFVFQTSSASLYINADEVKLLQVVNNLASNAVKFSPAENEITIRVNETDTEIIVSVKDHGIGIPDDLKPLIFHEQFGTGRQGLNGERSLGLGLSICKRLIDLMHGRIWFESEEGEGSTFYFSLPKQ